MTSETGEPRAADSAAENAIRELYQNLLRCWNERDAAAYAALFVERGNTIGFDGSPMNGPGEIERTLADIFAQHMTATYVSIVREVRLLGPNAGLLRAVAGLVPRGGSDINPAVNALQTLVATLHEGTWRIELFQNTPAAFHGRPDESEKLSRELRQAIR